jgi:hypothetical protein
LSGANTGYSREAVIRAEANMGNSGTVRDRLPGIRYVTFTARMILAATFLVSSFGKLVDIEYYSVAVVYNFGILPGSLAIVFGWALPFIELSLALCLLLGVLTRLCTLGTALLGVSFLVAKVILLSRGIDINCGCFGAIGTTMASWSVYLDPILILLSIIVSFSPRQSRHWASLGSKLSERQRDRLNLLW